ncbi:hypothetical protein CYMTET_33298, partial [Cymbomonas tetramitiformis]
MGNSGSKDESQYLFGSLIGKDVDQKLWSDLVKKAMEDMPIYALGPFNVNLYELQEQLAALTCNANVFRRDRVNHAGKRLTTTPLNDTEIDLVVGLMNWDPKLNKL